MSHLNHLINVVERQVDQDANSYLISLHDLFQNRVHEFNTFSNDIQRVLNVEKQIRDMICKLNTIKLAEKRHLELQRILIFTCSDFHGHIIRELDQRNVRNLLL